jgi:hypothetical protein
LEEAERRDEVFFKKRNAGVCFHEVLAVNVGLELAEENL